MGKSWARQGSHCRHSYSFSVALDVLATAMSQGRIKEHRIANEKAKLFLLADSMVLFKEKPEGCTRKQQNPVRSDTQTLWGSKFKINVLKSLAFQCSDTESTENQDSSLLHNSADKKDQEYILSGKWMTSTIKIVKYWWQKLWIQKNQKTLHVYGSE